MAYLSIMVCAALAAIIPAAARAAENISVSSCSGQLIMVETPGAPGGLVLTVVDQTSKHGANVTVSERSDPVIIASAGGGDLAVVVPAVWRPAVIAMASKPGFSVTAYLRYHMDGASYVVEDFRLVQSYAPTPECR